VRGGREITAKTKVSVIMKRLLLLSVAELADDYLGPHAVRAGGAAGCRASARGAPAPLSGAARPVGHAESVSVAPVEQLKQPIRAVTEQQLRDVSHLRHLLLVPKSRYNANGHCRYPAVRTE
jgi:hypothetical protein